MTIRLFPTRPRLDLQIIESGARLQTQLQNPKATCLFKMNTSSQITDYAVLPSPPFIEVAGIQNFRDLGGYPVSNRPNYSVRRDLIYRCAEPSSVTEDGIRTMQKLGVTHIYDLRSKIEIARSEAAGRGGIVQWDGCARVFAPVFTDQDYSPEQLALRYKDYTSGTEVMNGILIRASELCELSLI